MVIIHTQFFFEKMVGQVFLELIQYGFCTFGFDGIFQVLMLTFLAEGFSRGIAELLAYFPDRIIIIIFHLKSSGPSTNSHNA